MKTTDNHSESSARTVPFGRRSSALDGVRGMAILSVLCFHTLRVSGDGMLLVPAWRFFQESSWCGVDLFFVLSGFLITGILLDSRDYKGYFKNFYLRRALRIMPLYYATLLSALVIVPLLLGPSKLPDLYSKLLANQVWLWLYLQNFFQSQGAHQLPGFGHFWTLAVEEQFYWVWPLVVYFANRKWLLRICLTICVCEPLLRLILLETGTGTWALRELTFTRADTLLWGAIGAILARDAALRTRYLRVMHLAACVAAFTVVVMALYSGFLRYDGRDTVIAGYSALGLLFGVFVLSCAMSQGILARIVSAPLLQWFGKYSYSIYIVHPIALLVYGATVSPNLILGRFPAALVRFVTVTSFSALFAWLSWMLLESRFLVLKRNFEYRNNAGLPRSAAIEHAPADEVASVS